MQVISSSTIGSIVHTGMKSNLLERKQNMRTQECEPESRAAEPEEHKNTMRA